MSRSAPFLRMLLTRSRVTLGLTGTLALCGVLSWFHMPQQEDPSLTDRRGLVIAPYPGAAPGIVERLVLDPLEEALVQLEDVDELQSTVLPGVARITVELKDSVFADDEAWEKVREAVARARPLLPPSTPAPVVLDRATEVVSVVLAVTGSEEPTVLSATAKRLRDRLHAFGTVSHVLLHGDPGEQISILYDDAAASTLRLAPESLAQQLRARARELPGGTPRTGDRDVQLRSGAGFESLADLAGTLVETPAGDRLPLDQIARVLREPHYPGRSSMWLDGERAVAVGVVLPEDAVDAVAVGDRLRAYVDSLRPEFAPLRIEEVFFQPDRVERRLADLGLSLLSGMAIVALVLMLFLDRRAGLVIAVTVPLVTFSGLALHAFAGGVLHQVSVFALILALGILVDNAIVMVEAIQRRADDGMRLLLAAEASVRELAAPLACATGTTIAAFLPMLLASGQTAEFVRALPQLMIVIPVVSYLAALIVTPTLAHRFLAPGKERRHEAFEAIGRRFGGIALDDGGRVLGAACLVLLLGLSTAPVVKRAFFPDTDRDQLVIELAYPEGTFLEDTPAGARRLADALRALPEVEQVATFVGDGGPRFYYNLIGWPEATHRARIVLRARGERDVGPLMGTVRSPAAIHATSARVVPTRLGQGPWMRAPIEIQLVGADPRALAQAAERVLDLVDRVPGTVDAHHDLGIGGPTLDLVVDQAAALRHGTDRARVAEAVLEQTRGLPVATYFGGDDPVPVVLRGSTGIDTSVNALLGVGPTDSAGRLAQLTALGHAEAR